MAVPSTINAGDTAFVLISAALVMVMTPGLAFFYGGLVRRKNVLAIMMQSFISMGVVTVIWVLVGYSLAFSGNIGGVIGNLSWIGLRHVGVAPGPWAKTIPALAHFSFQEMFAIITPALITGAFADRVKFKSYLKFLVLWSLLVYVPIVHWIWGGGFLAKWGVLDFAGGMVVHASAGFAALASVWIVGARKFTPGEKVVPSNVAFVGLGMGLLWFGWFGFNAGSALGANAIAAQAFVNTDIAASVAMCTWLLMGWWRSGKPSAVGAFTGAVAGLACVTPCAGYVPTWAAFLIGLAAGAVCYTAVSLRDRMKWDDALDVWAAHGVGGLLGSILLGFFAYTTVNAAGANGLFAGNASFLGKQVAAALLVSAYSFAVTWLILKVINHFEPVRVPDETEAAGLDTDFEEQEIYAS
ncbi:MAG TPA: ammonium transporter [Acidimicrobiales bacterium]|nr:ammonium transporter [Acidimicrobiales bacterium]